MQKTTQDGGPPGATKSKLVPELVRRIYSITYTDGVRPDAA
jgi:hypothetical protein